MSKGYMYILECSDGSYYTGSTTDIEARLYQHQTGKGANHTKKRLPVTLVYTEEYDRIDDAFYREKQVQGWSRKKKEALINREYHKLPELSKAYSEQDDLDGRVISTGSITKMDNSMPEHIEGGEIGKESVGFDKLNQRDGNTLSEPTKAPSEPVEDEAKPQSKEARF